jgi:hypothetical protein
MLDLARIRAISIDLDDTLWPIWPVIQRAENALTHWLSDHAPMTSALFSNPHARHDIREHVIKTHPHLVHDLKAIRLEAIRLALYRAGENPLLYPVNFAMQMIEFLAKTVSHGMRLFGNMYAGELVFMLIALMGGTATVFGFLGHVVAGSIWAVFHILIVALQAFIFMMLTLVYIGQAHESH